jgi:hypothetical protein
VEGKRTNLITWAPLAGKWKFAGSTATYTGPEDPTSPHGVALSSLRLRSGSISAKISFDEAKESAGRIVFGYNSATGAYFSVGLGGYTRAYVLDEYVPARGWKGLRVLGSNQNLDPHLPYDLEVDLRGQSVRLTVNTVKVLEEHLPYPPTGDQIGLFAWGTTEVKFEETTGEGANPRAFVVMQFGEPYDSLYSEVIKPVAETMGLEAYRADDVYKPGIILQDIIRGILEAEVVIAEITPVNANVFYELGYAHALDKPTILLAERRSELPFDIRSYRCIFYDNTIRGKTGVETSLRQHLGNILQSA